MYFLRWLNVFFLKQLNIKAQRRGTCITLGLLWTNQKHSILKFIKTYKLEFCTIKSTIGSEVPSSWAMARCNIVSSFGWKKNSVQSRISLQSHRHNNNDHHNSLVIKVFMVNFNYCMTESSVIQYFQVGM